MNRWIAIVLFVVAFGVCCVGCDRAPATVPSIGPSLGVKTPSSPENPEPENPEKGNAVEEATFDDLKFEMELDAQFEKSMLTPKVNELFDKRVRIRGFIYPTLKKRGIKQFVLVRDNLECCFGPGAALYDCILVHMKEGKTAEFSIRPVAVLGKFSFDEFIDDFDGTTRAIYRLDGESVE